MTDRFIPHHKYPWLLIGRTYKIRDYQKPWEYEKDFKEEALEIEKE